MIFYLAGRCNIPIYELKCKDCGATGEEIMHHSKLDSFLQENVCSDCEGSLEKLVSVPARMAEQWADHPHGVNGRYSPALGCRVMNRRHEDQILKKRGLARESDLGTQYVERKMDKVAREQAARADKLNKLEQDLDHWYKKTGDWETTWNKAMPGKKILKTKEKS